MLILPKSRFDVSASRPHVLAPNHGVTESGLALVFAAGTGSDNAVKASTGAAGEVFAGFALTDQGYPTKLVNLYTFAGTGAVVASVVTLPNYINGSAYVRDQAGASASTKVTVSSSGLVATTNANLSTDVYTIVYSYTPTTPDMIRAFGEYQIGRAHV